MSHMIFVGVGPGDPELVTLKAIKALEAADIIALADSEMGESAAERIAAPWIQGKEVVRLPMPMRGERDNWREAHKDAASVLLERLMEGKRIAYPVLGDPLLYATSGYLIKLVEPHHPCEVVPGIPALCAVAARLKTPLAESRERLTILPGFPEDGDLPEGNVVVMKAGRTLSSLKRRLANGKRPAWVVQNLGMEEEKIAPIDCFDAEGKQSYFTTVLVKDHHNEG